jgi:hypothetical protein
MSGGEGVLAVLAATLVLAAVAVVLARRTNRKKDAHDR